MVPSDLLDGMNKDLIVEGIGSAFIRGFYQRKSGEKMGIVSKQKSPFRNLPERAFEIR